MATPSQARLNSEFEKAKQAMVLGQRAMDSQEPQPQPPTALPGSDLMLLLSLPC